MNDQLPSSNSLWEQYYQDPLLIDEYMIPCPEFSDATIVSTENTSDINETLVNPNYSSVVVTSNSTENSSDSGPKTSPVTPKRRRSRASKLTPTTFLNAHITNFRALVQKHTGCSHTEKGPITLCFGSSPSLSSSSTLTRDLQQIDGRNIAARSNSLEVESGWNYRDQQGLYQVQDQQYVYGQQNQQFPGQDSFS